MEQTNSKHSGIPMTPEELADWQKAFTDIEESIDALHKKETKPKRRNQV